MSDAQLHDALARLREREQQLAMIFNSVSDGLTLLRVHPHGRYTVAAINPLALRIMGKQAAEVIDVEVADLFSEPFYQQLIQMYEYVIAERRALEFETSVNLADQQQILAIKLIPISGDDGVITHLLGVSHDITEYRRIESDVRELNFSLEQRVLDRTTALYAANEALRESLHLAESIQHATPDLIYVIDLVEQRNLLSVERLGRLLGYSEEKIAAFGSGLFRAVLHPGDQARIDEHWKRCLHLVDDEVLESEYRLQAASGEWRWFLSRDLILKRDERGASLQILGFARDITARKRAEMLLHHSLERLNMLHAINQSALNLRPPEEIATDAIRQLRHVLQVARVSVLQFEDEGENAYVLAVDPIELMVVPLGERFVTEKLKGMSLVRKGMPFEVPDLQTLEQLSWIGRAVRAQGIRAAYSVPMMVRGELAGALTIFRNVPGPFSEEAIDLCWDVANHLGLAIEHSRLFSQVQNGRLRLQVLAKQLLEVQESERRQLAHELHDELGQVLTALKINLQSMRRAPDAETIHQHIDDNISVIEVTLQQVRSLSLNLRPPMLDDLGLTATLRWYFDRQERRSNVPIRFETQLAERRLAPMTETACFRIVQEAITNIVRHAQASQIEVSLHADVSNVILMVRDNGIGFDLTQLEAQSFREMGLGLLGMQERALLLGGRLNIESAIGAGTTITASLPVGQHISADQRRQRERL